MPGNEIRDRFAATQRHGRIHYHEAGAGEALVLMHTNGGSAHSYASVMGPLAQKFRVIAWDMPGHGDSDRITRHYRVADYADALADLLTTLGIDAAHVCGASIGGSITFAFATMFPERTLTAIPTETPSRSFDEWGARWSHTEANFSVPTQTKAQVEQRVNVVDDALLARWNIDRNKAGAWTMVDVMWGIREFDVLGAAARVSRPTLVLYGRTGPTVADEARFRKANPALPVEIIEGSGHFPMYDKPAEFIEIVSRFCSGAGRR